MEKKPIVVAISGVKNSGKTVFIEKLLPVLAGYGIKTAVIKHDGHRFSPDVPGTDSCRCLEAGACGAAVFDAEKMMVTRLTPVTEKELISLFPEADVILLEGFKYSTYPKIELVRHGISEKPVCDPATLLALATDTSLVIEGVECIGLNDTERAAGLIAGLLPENTYVIKQSSER